MRTKTNDKPHSPHDDGSETYALRKGWVDSELRDLDIDVEKDLVFARDSSATARH